MRYLCDPIGQIDGSNYEQLNCVAAGAAELADIATMGRLRLSGADVRRASDVTSPRGLALNEAASAVVELTNGQVILEPQYLDADGMQRTRLRNRVASGRAVGIVYDAAHTYGTPQATNFFRGRHFAVIGAYRWRADEEPHAEFYVEDPGTTKAGWRWWPAGLLYRAAESASGGGIWVLAAQDTEGVTRRARAKGNLRERPEVDSADIGNVRIGKSYHVIQTTRGGRWKRADGTWAYGWAQTRKKSGRLAWIKGESLA